MALLKEGVKCVRVEKYVDIDALSFMDIVSEFDAFCREHSITDDEAWIDLDSDYDSTNVTCRFITKRVPTKAELDHQARQAREAKEAKLAEDRRTIENILKRQPQLKMEYLLDSEGD